MIISHEERTKRRKRMATAIRQGASPEQVAREFGVTINSVRMACAEHRVICPRIRTVPELAKKR